MVDSSTAFIALLKQKQDNVSAFHCIVHRESLCAKSMANVIKITNMVREGNKSLTNRTFISFLEEIDIVYRDFLLRAEIGWFS